MSTSRVEQTRINNRLPIAREGIPFFIITGAVTLLFFYADFVFAGSFMGIISLFILYFFRDPERKNDYKSKAVLTPADGRILDIRHLPDDNNPLGEPAIKVSVFMSVFNVHVNRVPIDGRISEIAYTPGRFFSANLDKASEKNENNRITLVTDDGRKVVFTQIAGLIARRIVCWIRQHDYVKAGQRCGLIRFGSRIDLYLPHDSKIIVQPCHKVKAGQTIMGYLS
jgi:phosphatidylserine decarboxylase